MARTTVANQLAAIHKQRELLNKKEQALKSKSHDKVLAQIVKMAKDAGLTASDITKAMSSGKPAKANKAAKKEEKEYRVTCDKLVGSIRCNTSSDSWLRIKNHPDFAGTKDEDQLFNLPRFIRLLRATHEEQKGPMALKNKLDDIKEMRQKTSETKIRRVSQKN